MLTPRQKQIKDFVSYTVSKKGVAPTEREIARQFMISPSTAHEHIEALQARGHLEKMRKRARGIRILKSPTQLIRIPVLGTIAAGEPIEAIENKEAIAVPKSKLPRNGEVYALRVQGDSMIEEGVNDGDTILIKKQSIAENGDKVVALLNGNEATLKTFYKEKGRIRLQPANKNYEPIIVKRGQDISLQGILFDVIKTDEPERQVGPFVLPSKKDERQPIVFQKTFPYFEEQNFVLYQGDCVAILAQMSSDSVDMIFADPPYNLSNGGFSVHAGRRVIVNKGSWDKSRGFQDDYEFHHKWLGACRRVLKPNGTLWVSGTYHSIYQCGHAMQALGYHILNDISWFKPNAPPNLSCRYFTASHETLLWARKEKKAKHFFNYEVMRNLSDDTIHRKGKQMRSVWAIVTPKRDEKIFGKHPTQKPIELLRRIILASTKVGDVILDPFTGSSTTSIAAYPLKRKFIGIDIESEYLELSVKRFKEMRNITLA